MIRLPGMSASLSRLILGQVMNDELGLLVSAEGRAMIKPIEHTKSSVATHKQCASLLHISFVSLYTFAQVHRYHYIVFCFSSLHNFVAYQSSLCHYIR